MENYLSFNRLCLSLLFVASFVLMTVTFSQPASAAAVAVGGVGPGRPSLYVTGQPYYGYRYYHSYGGYYGAGGAGYYHRGSTYHGGNGGTYHGGTTYHNGNVHHHGYYQR